MLNVVLSRGVLVAVRDILKESEDAALHATLAIYWCAQSRPVNGVV